MNESISLKRNFFFNLISQITIFIIPIITTPYLSRVLHEEGTGQASYVFSLISYFIMFANLGFSIYGQRQIASCRDNYNDRCKVFFEIFILKLIFTTISTLVFLLLLFLNCFGTKYNILLISSIGQIIIVGFDVLFLYQGIEDFKSISIRVMLTKIVSAVFIFIFVKSENDTWIYCLVTSLSNIFAVLCMWPKLFKIFSFKNVRDINLKKHIVPSLLIFLPTLSMTIYSVFDKTLIGLLSSNPDYDNGCYEQAYKINSLVLSIVTVISPVLIPRNAYDYSHGNFESLKEHLLFAFRYVMILGFPLIAGFYVLSGNLSSWFLGDGYTEVPIMLVIMSVRFISSGFYVIFSDQFFVAIGKEKYSSISTAIAASINVALNFVLIPKYGAVGAAITTAISEVLVTIILAVLFFRFKILSFKTILCSSWKYITSSLIMGLILFFIQSKMSYSIMSFSIIVLVGVVIYSILLLLLHDSFVFMILKMIKIKITGGKK